MSLQKTVKLPWRQPFVVYEWVENHYELKNVAVHIFIMSVPNQLTVPHLSLLQDEPALKEQLLQQPFARFNNPALSQSLLLNSHGSISSADDATYDVQMRFHENDIVFDTESLLLQYQQSASNRIFEYTCPDSILSYQMVVPMRLQCLAEFQRVLRDRRYTVTKQISDLNLVLQTDNNVAMYDYVTRKLVKSITY